MWIVCMFVGHNLICVGQSDMQGELWTTYDYVCSRCGYYCNSSMG